MARLRDNQKEKDKTSFECTPRNPLTVHDPDPSGFTLSLWDCSCLTLPSRGPFTPWAGRVASQPPSSSGTPPTPQVGFGTCEHLEQGRGESMVLC